MTFVLLYGPPAVGKLTVARELAELTGFKLFHNHLSIDVVEPIFSRTSLSFGRTVTAIRKLVFEEAAREDVDLIFTYVYAHPQDSISVMARSLLSIAASGYILFFFSEHLF